MCQREICNLLLDYMWGSESLKVFPRWIVTAVLNVVSPLPSPFYSGEFILGRNEENSKHV